MTTDTLQQLKLLNANIKVIHKELHELKEKIDPLLPKGDRILNFNEAVEFLKISKRKLRQLVSDGEVPYSKKENRIRFSQNSLILWLNR